MSDDGSTKDDVKVPDGEVGDKINKLFTEESKDTSKYYLVYPWYLLTVLQTSSSLLLWARSVPLTPRKRPSPVKQPFRWAARPLAEQELWGVDGPDAKKRRFYVQYIGSQSALTLAPPGTSMRLCCDDQCLWFFRRIWLSCIARFHVTGLRSHGSAAYSRLCPCDENGKWMMLCNCSRSIGWDLIVRESYACWLAFQESALLAISSIRLYDLLKIKWLFSSIPLKSRWDSTLHHFHLREIVHLSYL